MFILYCRHPHAYIFHATFLLYHHDRVTSLDESCICCAQLSLISFYIQQGTIVIIVPAKTTGTAAISQIPTNVLVIQDSLGKTVKVGTDDY